jgi:hypothetical protein
MDEYLNISVEENTNFVVPVELEFGGIAFSGVVLNSSNSGAGSSIKIRASADTNIKPAVWLADIIKNAGLGTLSLPSVLSDFAVKKVSITYSSSDGIECDCSLDGILQKLIFAYNSPNYYTALEISDFKLKDLPIVGGYVNKAESLLKELGITSSITDTAVIYAKRTSENLAYNNHKLSDGFNFFTDFLGFKVSYPGESNNMPLADKFEKSSSSSDNALDTFPATEIVKWFDINKSLSVITIHQIGVSYAGEVISILLNISLNVSVLTFTVLGLKIGYDLNTSKVVAGISGLGLSFESGPLSLSGLFLKSGSKYTGTIAIKFGDIAINAIGSYDDEKKSVFAYAALMYNFGGPPVFFVTGIALGFGYGTRLILPTIETVESYPLITGVIKGKFEPNDITKLTENYIKSESNQYFLAAGVRFTSFGIIDSFALLTVSFGNDTEIGIIGISTLTMPPNLGAGTQPIAKARLAVLASIKPKQGLLKVEARLTSDSFIFSKDCKLTGGFAFYAWFGKEHNGDFVITLGGYHPDYKKPDHYPIVPRLGFNWNITKELSLSGEIYFALTPSIIMAGGRLSAVYKNGPLRAWFIAQADFLIAWKPFRYDIAISVSVGASLTLLFTFKLELRVSLHIWGPDFSGTAKVNWFILSFTINFGGGGQRKDIDWDDFVKSFLPVKDEKPAPISITFDSKPIGKKTDSKISKEEINIYSGNDFSINISSEIPLTSAANPAGVFPLSGCPKIESDISYNISSASSSPKTIETVISRNVPYALWGKTAGNPEKNEVIVVDAGKRVTFTHAEYQMFPKNTFISDDLLYTQGTFEIHKAFTFINDTKIEYKYAQTIADFKNSVMSDKVKSQRIAFIESFGKSVISSELCEYKEKCDSLFDENITVLPKKWF